MFYLLLGRSGDFQAPYMLNRKPEVLLARDLRANSLLSLSTEHLL